MKSMLEDITIMSVDEYDQIIGMRHEIVPGLWLGCHPDKVEPDLKYVLSLNGAKLFSTNASQRLISTYFEDSATLPAPAYLYSLADMAISLWRDGPILVHCAAGKNRSGLIVGLMLVRSGLMDANKAIKLMRDKRSNSVLHNSIFRNWLLEQESPIKHIKVWTPTESISMASLDSLDLHAEYHGG